MSIDDTKEKRFESDIESFFISKDGLTKDVQEALPIIETTEETT